MSFSPEWDVQYASGKQKTAWPFTDLVGLVRRYVGTPNRVLELGCGVGANAPFFSNYCAIEGSAVAAEQAAHYGKIVVGDFTKSIPFEPGFDLIFDRASVSHNDTRAIQSCLAMVYDLLKPGGLYIGVDWFSHLHDEYANSDPDTDEFTKSDYTVGQFAGVGRVHFSDEGHLRKLFERFEFLHLEEKIVRRIIPNETAATWNFVCKKLG